MPAAENVLDREFLVIRAKLLEVGAALDRIDRAEGSVDGDARIKQIREAIEVLQSGGRDRAEQIQLVFSRPYDDEWQTKLGVPAAS